MWCVHACAYIHAFMYTRVYMCIFYVRPVCVCALVCICVHLNMYMFAHVRMRLRRCAHVCVYVRVFVCLCVFARVHMCAHVCKCICVSVTLQHGDSKMRAGGIKRIQSKLHMIPLTGMCLNFQRRITYGH